MSLWTFVASGNAIGNHAVQWATQSTGHVIWRPIKHIEASTYFFRPLASLSFLLRGYTAHLTPVAMPIISTFLHLGAALCGSITTEPHHAQEGATSRRAPGSFAPCTTKL